MKKAFSRGLSLLALLALLGGVTNSVPAKDFDDYIDPPLNPTNIMTVEELEKALQQNSGDWLIPAEAGFTGYAINSDLTINENTRIGIFGQEEFLQPDTRIYMRAAMACTFTTLPVMTSYSITTAA